jgi:hypothetical protein
MFTQHAENSLRHRLMEAESTATSSSFLNMELDVARNWPFENLVGSDRRRATTRFDCKFGFSEVGNFSEFWIYLWERR